MKKKKLSLLGMSSLIATDVMYKSGITEIDTLKLRCFIFFLKKEGFSMLDLMKYSKQEQDGNSNPIHKFLLNFFKEHISSHANSCRKKYLEGVISTSNNISPEEAENAVEFVLEDYFRKKSNASVDSMQPKGLTKLMAHFIPERKDLSVYNPFAGLASFKLELPDVGFYLGQELDKDLWVLGFMRLMVSDSIKNNDYLNSNSLEYLLQPNKPKFDCVIFNPPLQISDIVSPDFEYPHNNANKFVSPHFVISQSFKLLKKSGKLIFLSANTILDSQQKSVFDFRKEMIINGFVEKVILLPSNTLISTAVSISVIVLSKQNNHNNTLLVDASEYFTKDNSRNIKLDYQGIIDLIDNVDSSNKKRHIEDKEIVSNNYNLSVKRYVTEDLGLSETQESQLVSLRDLIKVIEPQKHELSNKDRLVQMSGLSKNELVLKTNFENVQPKYGNKAGAALAINTLLIPMILKSLKPIYYVGLDTSLFYNHTNILNCNINEDLVLPEYLVLELRSKYVEKQLKKYSFGRSSHLMKINRKDLLKIKIILPSIFEQQQIINDFKSEIHNIELDKVKELAQEYGIDIADENSFLRHQISGRFKNIRGAFKSLQNILDEQIVKELPELYDYKRSKKLDNTLGSYLAIIDRDLRSIGDTLENVGAEINLADAKIESIDIRDFIVTYLNELKSRENNIFTLKFIDDPLYLEINAIDKILVRGDRNLLTKAFDNIISNAEKHGFENKISHNNRIEVQLMYSSEPDELQIDFANTGLAMSEDLTYERFIRKGDALGGNAGDGIGISFVYEVMKLHNGNLGYTDENGAEGFGGDLSVSVELTFPIEIKFTKDV